MRIEFRCMWTGLALCLAMASQAEQLQGGYAFSEFGTPKYGPEMQHWPYANPQAPKGGEIVLGAFGTFDSLNLYLLKGNWAGSIGLTLDSLMVSSGDELLSVYGNIAEKAEYPEDKSWIVFTLREQARFDDGKPIRAGDFKLAFDTIMMHGRPFFRSFYRDVEGVEVVSPLKLKFTFKTRNNMKPLMNVAQLSPAPRHHWESRDITKTTLEPWPSSGAYRIKSLEPGRSITYERVKDYWGADLPANRGLNNFDVIRYDYYRDLNVMFEAFKAGDIDFRAENSSKRWATGYELKSVASKSVLIETLPDRSPSGIQGLVINTRKPKFADVRVRQALATLFDFEWMRKKLLFNQYARTSSYFPNSDYGASGAPTAAEVTALAQYSGRIPAELVTSPFIPSRTDGSGRNRKQVRAALKLFKEAGFLVVDGKLQTNTGVPMKLEILLRQPDFERLMAPYVQTLKRVGIEGSIRIVDSSQYEKRTEEFDFDMTNVRFNFFPPPGPELRSFYGSAAAAQKGSGNLAGISDPVVDELIEKVISSRDLETLKVHTRALDRVLLWQHYIIPQWHNDVFRLAYWNRFSRPGVLPRYGTGFPSSWWHDAEKAAQLGR